MIFSTLLTLPVNSDIERDNKNIALVLTSLVVLFFSLSSLLCFLHGPKLATGFTVAGFALLIAFAIGLIIATMIISNS